MTQIFSIKSAAMLCVATLAMCFAGQDANAQCRGGGFGGFSPGFGGTSININRGGLNFGYASGFNRGFNNFGGFNSGFHGPRVAVPVFRQSTFYGGGFHGGGFHGRPVGGINLNFGPSFGGHRGFRHW